MSKILVGLDPRTESALSEFSNAADSFANDFKKSLKSGGDDVRKAIAQAFQIGADASAKGVTKAFTNATKSVVDAQNKLLEEQKKFAEEEAELQKKIDEAAEESVKNELKQKKQELTNELAKRRQEANLIARKAMQAFEDQSRKSLARIEEQQKILKDAQESSAKLYRTRLQEGGELAGEALTGALTVSAEDFGKILTGSIAKSGTILSRMSARALKRRAAGRAPGEKAGGMDALLAVGTKLGPVLLGLSAVVAGLAAVAFAADGQVREFNKTILDAAPAVDLFGKTVFDSGFNLKTSLKEVRDAAVAFSDITKVSAQDGLNLITKFNESGIALSQLRSEFSKTGSATEAYTEMAMFANTYTRALGISVDDLTTQFSFMFGKMGMGLGSIKDSFGAITAGAQVAGLNVKDFFTAVSQTTSGLALYNIRLDKTAAQLVGLMKIMDKEKAQELLQSKEMGGQGIEERFKAGMLVGGRGQKIFQAALSSQMESFTKDYGDTFGDVLKDKLDPKVLAKMSGKEFGALQRKIEEEGAKKGLPPEQAAMAGQRLEKLRKVAQGAQGGAMGMAKGMSGLSGLSDVAMRLTQGMSLVGAQSLDEMGYIARKNFEDLSGISGENFDQMASLLNRYQAAPENAGKSIPEILEAMASGKVPMTEADKKLFDKISEQKPKSMEQLAQDQVNATTSVTDVLKNKIAGLLESIGSTLSDIFDGLANYIDKFSDAKEKREQRLGVEEEVRGAKETSGSLGESIKALEKTLAAEMAKPESKERDAAVEGLGETVSTLKAQKAEADKRKEIGEKTLAGMGKGKSMTNAQAEALGVATTKTISTPAVPFLTELMGGQTIGKTDEELLEETGAAKEIAIKKASDDAIAQKKMEGLLKENEKQNLDIVNTLEEGQALSQLETQYGSAVGAAIGGDISFLRKAIGSDKAAKALAAKAGFPVEDFIYRGDGTRGTINPINKRDEFFGAKPGGAIDKAINGGGGGVVNIYISGDEAKVYNVVKRVIQESGLRAPAGGR
jgi:hypothetical protein